jgi:hypothetical protein
MAKNPSLASLTPHQDAPLVKRKGKPPVDPNETPEMRFIRVGQGRVGAAIKAIEMVGNLASPSCTYNATQMEKALKALDEAVSKAEAKLKAKLEGKTGAAAKSGFTF